MSITTTERLTASKRHLAEVVRAWKADRAGAAMANDAAAMEQIGRRITRLSSALEIINRLLCDDR